MSSAGHGHGFECERRPVPSHRHAHFLQFRNGPCTSPRPHTDAAQAGRRAAARGARPGLTAASPAGSDRSVSSRYFARCPSIDDTLRRHGWNPSRGSQPAPSRRLRSRTLLSLPPTLQTYCSTNRCQNHWRNALVGRPPEQRTPILHNWRLRRRSRRCRCETYLASRNAYNLPGNRWGRIPRSLRMGSFSPMPPFSHMTRARSNLARRANF